MEFNLILHYCPRCGADHFTERSHHYFHCEGCDFHYHINASTAVAGILTDDAGRVLLIRRGREPGKGKFSVPGGFVDAGETAEAALVREMREELRLEIASLEYLCSFPNRYEYRGVVYPVLDLVFHCRAASMEGLHASDEVDDYRFVPPHEIDLESLAFPSIRNALKRWRDGPD